MALTLKIIKANYCIDHLCYSHERNKSFCPTSNGNSTLKFIAPPYFFHEKTERVPLATNRFLYVNGVIRSWFENYNDPFSQIDSAKGHLSGKIYFTQTIYAIIILFHNNFGSLPQELFLSLSLQIIAQTLRFISVVPSTGKPSLEFSRCPCLLFKWMIRILFIWMISW